MNKENLHLPEIWSGSMFFHDTKWAMRVPHQHDELELNLVTSGSAAYLLGERRYDLRRNSLVWLFPGQCHILLDKSLDHQMWIGLFKRDILLPLEANAETAVLCEDAPTGHFCRQVSEAAAARLSTLFQEIATVRDDTLWLNAGLTYALHSAWAAYSSAKSPVTGPSVHPAVERAARLLRDDSEPWTAAQLAAHVALSESHLSRLFHAQTGVTLVDFRNRQRVERFIRIFGDGRSVSALEAAFEAGFGSYAQFHRVFSEQMSCSPAEYRRMQRTPAI